jgi:small Trp-rich protein
MWLVVLGTILSLLKLADVALVQTSWIWVLSPYAVAAVWWLIADLSGFTKRQAMRKMDDKKEARRRKALESLGITSHSSRTKKVAAKAREVQKEKVEGERSKKREFNESVVRDSVMNSRISSFDESTQAGDLDPPTQQMPKR